VRIYSTPALIDPYAQTQALALEITECRRFIHANAMMALRALIVSSIFQRHMCHQLQIQAAWTQILTRALDTPLRTFASTAT
jgi:hypothetical protein